jgi:hypothetical protein
VLQGRTVVNDELQQLGVCDPATLGADDQRRRTGRRLGEGVEHVTQPKLRRPTFHVGAGADFASTLVISNLLCDSHR